MNLDNYMVRNLDLNYYCQKCGLVLEPFESQICSDCYKEPEEEETPDSIKAEQEMYRKLDEIDALVKVSLLGLSLKMRMQRGKL